MLWSGESPKAESLKETMVSYFNALQGFFAMEALLVLALRSLLSYMSLLSKSLILASDCCRALSPYTRDHMRRTRSRLSHSFRELFGRNARVSRRFLRQTLSR